jgi:DNA invertase Pin-like site-specific DNA recombinase
VAVFEDAGISGASMNGREGLHAALKSTTKGMALVTYSISRLARSTKDLLAIAETLRTRKAALVSVTEQIGTASAMGEFFFTVMGAIATLERKVTGERTKMALAHKKAKGEVYAATPFGFEAIEGRSNSTERPRICYPSTWSKARYRRSIGSAFARLSLRPLAQPLRARGVPSEPLR